MPLSGSPGVYPEDALGVLRLERIGRRLVRSLTWCEAQFRGSSCEG
jgi:hypothetical protein